MRILGISCFYHDAAACLVEDGRLVAAVEEERFSRVKHDPNFPAAAIRFCLEEGRVDVDALDYVVFHEKPLRKFERILASFLQGAPASYRSFMYATPLWLRDKLQLGKLLKKHFDYQGRLLYMDHHLSHAASAFLVSPFEEAAILTVDGVGEWATAAYGVGRGTSIDLTHEIRFPNSLGLLYAAVTYHLGFKINEDEYKVMGLAPYGKPTLLEPLRRLIDIRPDGSFRLEMSYFDYHRRLRMLSDRFAREFGPRREPDDPIGPEHQDLASSVQALFEEVVLAMSRHVRRETGLERLCLAGGCGLNCVANGRILEKEIFRDLYVQPAAGDSGGALGAAFYLYHSVLGNPRSMVMETARLGPEFRDEEIARFLERRGIEAARYDREALLDEVARKLSGERVVGWFQGRMEFGPRALGSRSILASPRRAQMRDVLNEKVKHRELFRPFAPAAPLERSREFFECPIESPFMLLAVPVVRERQRDIAAVVHVDGSARLQTVRREENPLFYDLLLAFERHAGVPVLINTSFNLRGEPIVCTPEEAWSTFQRTEIDDLVLGSFIISREELRESEHKGEVVEAKAGAEHLTGTF